MDLFPYKWGILSWGVYASFKWFLKKTFRRLLWLDGFIFLFEFAGLLRQVDVDLVTTADEYLLNWFLLMYCFTLFLIIGGIILDLVESVSVIWLHLVQLAFIHPVTLEVSDEHASTCQPYLSLSMHHCLLQLCWARLPATYISLCL